MQLDQVLGVLHTNTRKDLEDLLAGYGDALNGQPQPGEDDDQVTEVQGKTGGQALNESPQHGVRLAAQTSDREPGHARHGDP